MLKVAMVAVTSDLLSYEEADRLAIAASSEGSDVDIVPDFSEV